MMDVPEGLESSYAAARAHLDALGLAEVLRRLPLEGSAFHDAVYQDPGVANWARDHVPAWVNEWIDQRRVERPPVPHDEITLDGWRRRVAATWGVYKIY